MSQDVKLQPEDMCFPFLGILGDAYGIRMKGNQYICIWVCFLSPHLGMDYCDSPNSQASDLSVYFKEDTKKQYQKTSKCNGTQI